MKSSTKTLTNRINNLDITVVITALGDRQVKVWNSATGRFFVIPEPQARDLAASMLTAGWTKA